MLEGVVIDDTELFNDRLQEWGSFYNFKRPMGASGARRRMRGSARRRGPGRERTPSAGQVRPSVHGVAAESLKSLSRRIGRRPLG